MAGLQILSTRPEDDEDMPTQRAVMDILDTGTTRSYTLDRIATIGANYATLNYVNAADNGFVTPSTVNTADELNIPVAAKGAPNGIGTLDSSGDLLLSQCPNLGIGFLKGPYGVTSQITADTTTSSQTLLAQIDLGSSGTAVTFKPLCFATVFVQQSIASARAVLEMRIGTNLQTTYATQTLVASGYGRGGYIDFQPISLGPAGATTAMSASAGYSPSTHWVLSLWLTSSGGQSLVRLNNILTCSAYLLRTIQ